MGRRDMKAVKADLKDMKYNIEQNRETYRKNMVKIKNMKIQRDLMKIELNLEVEMDKAKLDGGLRVIDPKFEFETTQRWQELNKEAVELSIKKKQQNMQQALQAYDAEFRKIEEQQERIPKIEEEILENMKRMGINTSEYENNRPDYIG